MKRQRSGSLYHQKYPPEGVPYAVAKAAATLKESPVWWAKYYVNGRPVRVSTGTEKQQEAERFLADRTGRVATGQPILPRADRVRYDELAADLRAHYQVTGCRGLKEAGWRLTHLDRFFAGRRAADIGQAEATAYAVQRQAPARRTARWTASWPCSARCCAWPTSRASSCASPCSPS